MQKIKEKVCIRVAAVNRNRMFFKFFLVYDML